MNQKNPNKNFITLAVVCCFLSIITTVGIHSSLFDLGNLSPEDKLLLFNNKTYLANRFWVIFHCLFVLISMCGFAIIQFKRSPGFIGLGFTFFSVFSFAEIFRQILVLFYLNNLRQSYIAATDESIREIIMLNIEHTGLIGYAIFGLFVISFGFGNICYGISILNDNTKLGKYLAYLLIIWGCKSLIVFGNQFWEIKSLSSILKYLNLFYQPLVRLLIALWLLNHLRLLTKLNITHV